jgi:hypothetical protein
MVLLTFGSVASLLAATFYQGNPDTILEEDHPMTIPSKFGSN